MRRLEFGVLLLAVATASGCATWRKPPPPVEVSAVDRALLEAAKRIERSTRSIARPVGAVGGPAPAADDYALPPELTRRVDVRWHGDLYPVVEAIADAIGYAFREVGPRPAMPIIVLIDAEDAPVGAVLRSAGQQAGARADVVVRMSPPEIDVVYRD